MWHQVNIPKKQTKPRANKYLNLLLNHRLQKKSLDLLAAKKKRTNREGVMVLKVRTH